MAIDRTRQDDNGELIFTLRDPDQLYTHDEVCDLLEAAEKLGFDLSTNELNGLTIRELDVLVNRKQ